MAERSAPLLLAVQKLVGAVSQRAVVESLLEANSRPSRTIGKQDLMLRPRIARRATDAVGENSQRESASAVGSPQRGRSAVGELGLNESFGDEHPAALVVRHVAIGREAGAGPSGRGAP